MFNMSFFHSDFKIFFLSLWFSVFWLCGFLVLLAVHWDSLIHKFMLFHKILRIIGVFNCVCPFLSFNSLCIWKTYMLGCLILIQRSWNLCSFSLSLSIFFFPLFSTAFDFPIKSFNLFSKIRVFILTTPNWTVII